MNQWSAIGAMLEVELTSAEPEQTLMCLNHAQVEVYYVVCSGELSRRFRIKRRDYKTAQALTQRRGDRLQIVKKTGVFWYAARFLRRPVLLAGITAIAALSLFLPSRIFFFQVEGNQIISDREILSAAEKCGLSFGVPRQELRSEKIKNALLSSIQQLQWAGVNTAGCVATISVRERAQQTPPVKEEHAVSIVADRDGYVLETNVTKGNPLIHPGQAVKEGQVLISAYTDCGAKIQVTRAEGEILALTTRRLTAFMPSESALRGELQQTRRRISILLQKKRINLWKDSGIWGTTCGRIIRDYNLTLPGGFRLPITLQIETFYGYTPQPFLPLDSDISQKLIPAVTSYLVQQMVAGQIQSAQTHVIQTDGFACLDGRFLCTEMIGRERAEQIGDIHGENR